MREPDPGVFIPKQLTLEAKFEDEGDQRMFEELVRFERGAAFVDWAKFVEMSDFPDEAGEDFYHLAVKYLVNLDVLSFDDKDNFSNVESNGIVNPTYKDKFLYFTRQEDSRGYSKSLDLFGLKDRSN